LPDLINPQAGNPDIFVIKEKSLAMKTRLRMLSSNIFLSILCLLFASITAEAKEISVPDEFASIQLAVDSAISDDVIVVAPGIYYENISIGKPLTVWSKKGPKDTFIRSKDPNKAVFTLLETAGVRITGLAIEGSYKAGVHIYKSSASAIYDNVFKDNYNGIYLQNSTDNSLKNNVVDGNVTGIYLYYSDKNEILKNSTDSNSDKGIVLHASHDNKIIDNKVNGNLWNGITLTSSNRNIVRDNRVVRNTFAIVISNECKENIVENNTTMRRIHLILPVILIYFAIFLYLIERKLFITYYRIRNQQ